MNNPLESPSIQKPNFTEAARQLDSILDRFRNDTLPLEESLTLFEEAIAHLKVCQTQLTGAQGRVEELVKSLEGDALIAEPFALMDRP